MLSQGTYMKGSLWLADISWLADMLVSAVKTTSMHTRWMVCSQCSRACGLFYWNDTSLHFLEVGHLLISG